MTTLHYILDLLLRRRSRRERETEFLGYEAYTTADRVPASVPAKKAPAPAGTEGRKTA